ncbi:MAG TPA: hypothetical protein VG672_04590 [Bryobacteraceae bacterium]|nr:hypothetical protein [Bryobacteraceae bacterium]
MGLTNVEREKLTDSMLKIQSVRTTLGQVDESKVPDSEEIHRCLEDADASLRTALGYQKAK